MAVPGAVEAMRPPRASFNLRSAVPSGGTADGEPPFALAQDSLAVGQPWLRPILSSGRAAELGSEQTGDEQPTGGPALAPWAPQHACQLFRAIGVPTSPREGCQRLNQKSTTNDFERLTRKCTPALVVRAVHR